MIKIILSTYSSPFYLSVFVVEHLKYTVLLILKHTDVVIKYIHPFVQRFQDSVLFSVETFLTFDKNYPFPLSSLPASGNNYYGFKLPRVQHGKFYRNEIMQFQASCVWN